MAIALTLLMTASAAAQPQPRSPTPDEEARATALYERGLEDYKLAEYDAAITAFKEAYRLVPEPGFLFNIAQAYRLDENCKQAAWFYKKYLQDAPTAENASTAKALQGEMEACAAKQALDPKPDLTPDPTLDPNPTQPDPTPSTGPIAARPGQAGSWKRWTGIGLASGGAVALGASFFFGSKASQASDDITTCIGNINAPGSVATVEMCLGTEGFDEIDARGKSAESKQILFGAAGGALLTAGIVLVVLDLTGDRRETPPVAITAHPDGGMVSWAGRF